MGAVDFFRVLFVRTASLGSLFARWGLYFFSRIVSKNIVIWLSVRYVGRCFFSCFVSWDSGIGLSFGRWGRCVFFAFFIKNSVIGLSVRWLGTVFFSFFY